MRCHACDGRTNGKWKIEQCSVGPETAIYFISLLLKEFIFVGKLSDAHLLNDVGESSSEHDCVTQWTKAPDHSDALMLSYKSPVFAFHSCYKWALGHNAYRVDLSLG